MSDRPNMLVMLTDQQRHDTIHAINNPVIRTPAFDRLAAEGAAFTSCYSPSPVCVPARASAYWGEYPCRTGCYENGFPMPYERPTFYARLGEAGYRTHGIGKFHFSRDPFDRHGFDARETQEELHNQPERDDYLRWLYEQGFGHVCDPHGIRGEMYYVPQPAQMPARLHPTQWVGDRAVDFIQKQPDDGQPWMLFANFIHPHPPFAPPNPWHKLYRGPLMPPPHLPPDMAQLHTWVNRHQNRYKYRDQGFDMNLVRQMKAYYFACVSFIDYQVGRMLQALEAQGVLDDTLIILSSDHGELLGDYGCFGKRSYHDAASRVPMLVRHPGRFTPGTRCDRVASLVDIAATALAAAGMDQPETFDGEDLADIAAGRSDRGAVYMQHHTGDQAMHAIVTERWKYAWSAPDQRAFFHDRVNDPTESRNLAGLSLASGHEDDLRSRLIDHLTERGEIANIEDGGWRAQPIRTLPANPDAGLLVQDHAWADTTIPGYTDA